MTLISQSGEGHIKDRLYVYWDITTRCNYKCSYCYARHKYLPQGMWNIQPDFTQQRVILAALKCSRLPVYLGFHGGEPLVHPHITELVKLTLGSLNHDLSTLYIATNLSTIKPIDSFPDSRKLRILASFHPEYSDPKGFVNRAIHVSKRFKTKVNVLLHTDKRLWGAMRYVYDQCFDAGLTMHPHFIYDQDGDDEILWRYTNEFFKHFNYMKRSPCKYNYTYDTGDQLLSDVEVFEAGLNNFKGWSCYNNNYEILIDNTVHRLCSSDFVDLVKHPLFFNKITIIQPMKCPFNTCSSDGVLKCLKIAPKS